MMRSILLLMVFLAGCSTGTLCCPDDHVTTAAIGGANLATFAGELAPVIVGALSTPRRLGAAPAPFTSAGVCQGSSMTFHSLDIFGTTTYSCGTQPAPVVMNVVSASVTPPAPVTQSEPLPPTRVH